MPTLNWLTRKADLLENRRARTDSLSPFLRWVRLKEALSCVAGK
jgi:hypothetical protein